ncbi:MAG TPA: hypothetical protein VKB25_04100 [Conexibacter sp.]|nr:hypothetical protein [Conexibacter sp.]
MTTTAGPPVAAPTVEHVVPPVYCPIAPALHPDVELLQTRALQWMTSCGFGADTIQRGLVAGTDSAEFFARITPAGHLEPMQAAVDWCYLMFVFDDRWTETSSSAAACGEFVAFSSLLLRVLETPGNDLRIAHPVVEPARDIATRLRRRATDTQWVRWVEAHRAWFDGVAWSLALESPGVMPDLDTYVAMRLHSCAGPAVTAFIEIANGEEIPADELDAPAVRALTEMTWAIAAWDNDLVSHGKEVWLLERDHADAATRPLSLIEVLARRDGSSIETATATAVAMRDRVMCRFLRLASEVGPRLSAPTRRYVEDLGHLIRGNFEWSLTTARYRDPDGRSPDAVRVTSGFAPEPADASLEPLALPSIAWWWDVR